MRGVIPPLPQYVFMAWCTVKEKHRDKFTLPFLNIFYILLVENPVACSVLFLFCRLGGSE
jgi:hypothetical protein